ncbi:MAG TPA: DUF2207 domain-containing protein [Thermoanaerobaculia bacterium]|nr:DUF2207 domain-containing protein [Thermoanaerobaculia bacterium]
MRFRVHLVAILLAALPCCLEAQSRSLRWRSLDVSARLDADGKLHVTERHAMLFDGAWNGGERQFRVDGGQRLELISIARIDPATGRARELAMGSPSSLELDQYAWFDERTLRWRSRRPGDPPFRNSLLVYEIRYALTGVVYREAESHRLDHDFAFPDRDGPIEAFTLELELDPAWSPAEPIPPRLTAGPLQPGESFVVSAGLARASSEPPAFVNEGAPGAPALTGVSTPPATLPIRMAAMGLFAGLAALAWKRFERRERAAGRFDPLPPMSRSWLAENVFAHRPEVVGAAWDGQTGRAEVAALIAVMSAEGKIETEPGDGSELRLRLAVPRESLSAYERDFVTRFFPQGDVTSPSILQAEYGKTGFDPAAAIRSYLDHASHPLVGRTIALNFSALVFVGMAFFMMTGFGSVLTGLLGEILGETIGRLGGGMMLAALLTVLAASIYRLGPEIRRPPWILPLPALACAIAVVVLAPTFGTLAFLFVIPLIILAVGLRIARTWRTPEQFRTLRGLRAARQYLRELLRRNDPDVEESWMPYLIAFDLAWDLDRWSIAAPERAAAWRSSRLVSGGAASGSGGAAGLAPGGGAFGGAGASGGWAAAVSSMASTISAPGSGGSSRGGWSGGGGGGGGGGRSGGGGGGGW